ncbi:MAG: tyrosine-type recombinase/integrase [Planctomycetes bacterium]|nr:tyrosine-type recombinase/integrase [Planctomycetota bacterium]
MQPNKLRVPSLTHHVASGQDVVYLRDANGKRRQVYCGPHDSAEAQRRYREVLAEHLAGKVVSAGRHRPKSESKWPTVGQLCALFLLHADSYYVDADGNRTNQSVHFELAFAPLLELYRDVPTDQFTVVELGRVRQAMVDARIDYKGHRGRTPVDGRWCRKYINGNVRRIQQAFRWGVTQGHVPGSVWHGLSALKGLPAKRSGVPDRKPVEAVPWKLVEATLPFLVPTVQALVMLQWHTGMRPSETLSMTRGQLTLAGESEPWIYRPTRHKGGWRGKERVVVLGPSALEIVRPRLKADPEAALFAPQDAWAEFAAAKRAGRKTSKTKQMSRRDARATEVARRPFMDVDAYRRHIERACDKAGVPRWSPHRLRHACATRLVLESGIEGARAVLGHTDERVTRRYSIGADTALAAAVMRKYG